MASTAQKIFGAALLLFEFFVLSGLLYAEKRIGGLNPSYVNTFSLLLIACIVATAIFYVIMLLKEDDGLLGTVGVLCESQDYRLLARWPWNLLAIVLFALFVGVSVSFFGVEFFPEQSDIGDLYGTSQLSSAYYQSVPPALAEDMIFMNVVPSVFVFALAGLWILFGRDLNKWSFLGIVLLACVVPSGIAGLLIPGFSGNYVTPEFAGAHEAVQGATADQNPGFFWSAALFAYFQSVLYQLTGLWLPLAHFTHNFLISLSWVFGVAVGSVALKLALFYPLRVVNRRVRKWKVGTG